MYLFLHSFKIIWFLILISIIFIFFNFSSFNTSNDWFKDFLTLDFGNLIIMPFFISISHLFEGKKTCFLFASMKF